MTNTSRSIYRRQLLQGKWPKPAWATQQLIRWDRGGLVEDVCAHGVGHPNAVWMSDKPSMEGIHGCDGCCR